MFMNVDGSLVDHCEEIVVFVKKENTEISNLGYMDICEDIVFCARNIFLIFSHTLFSFSHNFPHGIRKHIILTFNRFSGVF